MPVDNSTPKIPLPYRYGFYVAPFAEPITQMHLMPLEMAAQSLYVAAKASGDLFERTALPSVRAAALAVAEREANVAEGEALRAGMLGMTPLWMLAVNRKAIARGFADGLAADP